jgi:hypothetical protein
MVRDLLTPHCRVINEVLASREKFRRLSRIVARAAQRRPLRLAARAIIQDMSPIRSRPHQHTCGKAQLDRQSAGGKPKLEA